TRGWTPRWWRMSTSVTTRAARASAAPSTASGVPRKVMTERWWSGSAWTFASVTPGTARMVEASASMRARSRPSLTFGTHSTTAAGPPAAAAPGMRCILLGGMQFLPIGKLGAETLQAIFDKHPLRDPRVVVGPKVGEDAAVIDMGDRYLVATTDPITFATDEIGWYALQVNANDIAVRGARPATIRKARNFLRAPGLSVLPEVEIACELAPVHAMHDPTEGGVATALVELADAARVGLRIDRDRIIVLPEGRTLCEAFGLDPLGTIASGALLMTLAPGDASIVIHALAREGIDCHFIGQVVERGEGLTLVSGSRREPLTAFAQDEISKLFRGA